LELPRELPSCHDRRSFGQILLCPPPRPPFLGKSKVRYTPCPNFVGTDNFSYTLTGVSDPGTGIVTVNVEGEICDYCEALHCNGQPANPRIWVHKSVVEQNGGGFMHNGNCYYADATCPTCPPQNATVITPTVFLAEGCNDPDCYGCPHHCGS